MPRKRKIDTVDDLLVKHEAKPANDPVVAEVSVQNDVRQQLYRRQLQLGNTTGEVNTSPLNRDYDAQFGYPVQINKFDYQHMYDRDPVAHRVVELYPIECWQQLPEVLDSDSPTQSDFEKQVHKVFSQHNLWGMLRRIDILSGIGNFGILLMGVGDGKPLDQPITLKKEDGTRYRYKLQYVRAFPHAQVEISQFEMDRTNPRFGHPVMYRIQFQPNDLVTDIDGYVDLSMQEVHWTRVIHIADNREVSEIFGVPRLQRVYNALLDLNKVFGSSGEMFYKGAYPGFVVEATDNLLNTVQLDSESIRREVEKYENNFQRWMALKNAHVNPLSSSYADPSGHVEVCLNRIAVAMGCPVRILLGSERGELASSQDAVIWKTRLMERQSSYITPFVIKPVIQYLVRYGMVDPPYDNDFHVTWPDISADTKADIYEIRSRQLDFIRGYQDVMDFFSPVDFLVKFCDMSDEEAETVIKNAEEYKQKQMEKEAEASFGQGGEGGAGGGFGGDLGGMGGDMGGGDMGGGMSETPEAPSGGDMGGPDLGATAGGSSSGGAPSDLAI